MNDDDSCFKGMNHDQIMDAIEYGLHHLTTIDLVRLHSIISNIQIERTHIHEKEKKD